MKKSIVSLIAVAVMVPNISFAQISAETENALLRQLVSLLTQQVQLLQAQIEQLTTERDTFRTELDQLKVTNDLNTSYIEEQKQIAADEMQAEAEKQEKLDTLEETLEQERSKLTEYIDELRDVCSVMGAGDGVYTIKNYYNRSNSQFCVGEETKANDMLSSVRELESKLAELISE